MQITAKLTQILDVETFNTSNGEFKVQRIIVEQENQEYQRDLCIDLNPDRISVQSFPIGARLVLDVNLQSRNYNGKWYTKVKAWNIRQADAGYNASPIPDAYKAPENNLGNQQQNLAGVAAQAAGEGDELPF